MSPPTELTRFLREYLKDGHWHDETDLVEKALFLVDPKRALKRYASRIGGKPSHEALKAAQRAIILEALEKSGALLQRQWKRGAYRGSARTVDFSIQLVDYLSDGHWHSLADMLDHVPVRPEVAIRCYASRFGTKSARAPKSGATPLSEQIYRGSLWYIQHAISDLTNRRKPPLMIDRRGKRGASEYRLME